MIGGIDAAVAAGLRNHPAPIAGLSTAAATTRAIHSPGTGIVSRRRHHPNRGNHPHPAKRRGARRHRAHPNLPQLLPGTGDHRTIAVAQGPGRNIKQSVRRVTAAVTPTQSGASATPWGRQERYQGTRPSTPRPAAKNRVRSAPAGRRQLQHAPGRILSTGGRRFGQTASCPPRRPLRHPQCMPPPVTSVNPAPPVWPGLMGKKFGFSRGRSAKSCAGWWWSRRASTASRHRPFLISGHADL